MGYRETPAEFLGRKVSKYLGDENLSITHLTNNLESQQYAEVHIL